MMKSKKKEMIFYVAILIFILFVISISIIVMKNSEWFYCVPNQVTVSESANISTINLCVVKKSSLSGGMTGIFVEYYLVLSNDMIVYVTAKEFNEYDENQYYDFELVEKTTVSSEVMLKSRNQVNLLTD